MTLLERTRTGLREMPSNAAWLASRALAPKDAVGSAAESAASRAREQSWRLSEALGDAMPGGSDSIQVRMKRAQDAADDAREAEQRAVEAAQEARERSDHALHVSGRGRARIKEVERETAREMEQRIREAERDAEEALKRDRFAAEEAARRQRDQVYADVHEENESAQSEAESAQQRAEELVAEAHEKMVEARRLADAVAEASRAAADQASLHAQQLTRDLDNQAKEAAARVRRAEGHRERSESTVRRTSRNRTNSPGSTKLGELTRSELHDLASTMEIVGRAGMRKSELITAIRKSSRTATLPR